MPTDLTGLSPAAIARLNAVADNQAVAVRLLDLPPALKNNPSPIKIEGTVMGQNPDGSVQVNTNKGVINVMLKDRQNLPQGIRLEIDIPAGRNPQQGSIRNAPEAAPTQAPAPVAPTAPSLTQAAAQNPLTTAATAAALKLDRISNLKATEIEDALKAAAPKIADAIPAKNIAAPIQAGQTLRLMPVPPGQSNAVPMLPGQVAPLPEGDALVALLGLTDALPEDMAPLKTGLTSLLGRMDLSALQVKGDKDAPPTPLPQNIQKILQAIDPENKNNTIRYEPVKLFNPSKQLEIQIAGVIPAVIRPGSPAPATGGVQVMLSGSGGGTPATPLTSGAVPQQRPAQILPAQVIGFTGKNFPVLNVSFPAAGFSQNYVMPFQATNLQPGSQVLLSLVPGAIVEAGVAAPMTTASPLPPGQPALATWMMSGTWDGMTDLMQILQHGSPAAAQNLAQILPSAAQSHNVGPLAMLFLSVLRSGDLESWMPSQVLGILRQTGKMEALRAVHTDIALGNRADTQPLAQDWRATVLPYYHDQQVHKLPLFYKHGQEEEKDEHGRRRQTLRFLFDLKLSRMGQVQVDGFMQPERLDMIMRTKTPLSVPMQSMMKGLYVGAMEKSNLRGELSFQFKPENWVSLDDKLNELNQARHADQIVI